MMRTLARLVIRFPRTIVLSVLVLTAILGWSATRIQRRVDLEENLPRSNPRLAVFHEFREMYGSGSSMVAILTARDIFSPHALGLVDRLTRGLRDVEGVKRVTSLTNLTEFQGQGDLLKSGPLVAEVPRTKGESGVLRGRIMSDPWYAGRLVSRDGRSTIISVNLANADTLEEALATLDRIRAYVDRAKGDLTVNYAGSLVMDEQIDRALGRDVAVLFPIVLLAIAAILFLSFRNLQGVFLPLATVLMSVAWTLGVMALLGRTLSLVNNIMPVLLIGVGSAYGIHIVARYQEALRDGLAKRDAVRLTVAGTGFGVWMAAITTVAGFGSLALSKIRMIFDFGVFSALGVAVAFLISLTFIPALLILQRPPRLRVSRKKGERAATEAGRGLLSASARVFTRHPVITIGVSVLVMALALAGWPRLRATFEPAEFLPAGSDHRRAEALVDAKFGGSAELEVLVRGDLNDAEVLRKIERFQAAMRELGTSRPISIVDLLARVNRAFHGGDPAYEVLPAESVVVPQYLLLLTLSTTPDELAQFMSFDQTEARISARISNVMSTGARTRLIADLERRAAEIFGRDAQVRVTGMPIIELAMMDIIRDEQMQNIYSSLAAVLCLVVLAFRSLAAGVVCLAPIGLTIIYCFGLMGWFGIPLNAATATMASLATGMGVDYSIHFYRRYLEERRRGLGLEDAVAATAGTTGAAIVANALAVGAGFAILLFSKLQIFRSFGGLIALTMLLTAFGALTVLPALLQLRVRLLGEPRIVRLPGARNAKLPSSNH